MSDRWQLGSYTFVINPNKYGETVSVIGDNAVSLNGNTISMPTVLQEQYNFSSTLYQGLPKIMSQVSVPHGAGIKMLSGNYYILNNSTEGVDQYNPNFSLIKSVSVGSQAGSQLTSFDIGPDGTIYAVDNAITQDLHIVTPAIVNTSRAIVGLSGNITGIKYDNGYYWFVTDQQILYKTDTNINIINQLNLPYIQPQYLKYRGMTIVGNYLVLSFNSSDMTGAYHIDRTTGIIANAFSLPSYIPVVDVEYDGKNFIFMTNTGSQLIFTNGNTLLADIYTIESNIRNNGYLYMIDDMNVTRKISVGSYTIDRVDGHLQMYNISLQVSKIDRG